MVVVKKKRKKQTFILDDLVFSFIAFLSLSAFSPAKSSNNAHLHLLILVLKCKKKSIVQIKNKNKKALLTPQIEFILVLPPR